MPEQSRGNTGEMFNFAGKATYWFTNHSLYGVTYLPNFKVQDPLGIPITMQLNSIELSLTKLANSSESMTLTGFAKLDLSGLLGSVKKWLPSLVIQGRGGLSWTTGAKPQIVATGALPLSWPKHLPVQIEEWAMQIGPTDADQPPIEGNVIFRIKVGKPGIKIKAAIKYDPKTARLSFYTNSGRKCTKIFGGFSLCKTSLAAEFDFLTLDMYKVWQHLIRVYTSHT